MPSYCLSILSAFISSLSWIQDDRIGPTSLVLGQCGIVRGVWVWRTVSGKTYSLLGQLPRALVLGVSEQFDDAALVGGKTGDFADDITHERGALAEVALGARDTGGGLNRGYLL